MRFAIAAISSRGGRQKASEVCGFVRSCKAGESFRRYAVAFDVQRSLDFETLTPHFKELRKKQHVTSQSLQKIEDGMYGHGLWIFRSDEPW